MTPVSGLRTGVKVALRPSWEARQGGAAVKHSKRRVLTQAHIVNIEHPIKHIPRRGRHTTLIKTFLGLPIRPVVLGPKCAAWVPVSCPHTSHASSRRWVRQSAVWRVIPGRGVRRTAQKRLQEGCQHDLIPVDIQQKRASGGRRRQHHGCPRPNRVRGGLGRWSLLGA